MIPFLLCKPKAGIKTFDATDFCFIPVCYDDNAFFNTELELGPREVSPVHLYIIAGQAAEEEKERDAHMHIAARHRHVAAKASTPLYVSCCLSVGLLLTQSMPPD